MNRTVVLALLSTCLLPLTAYAELHAGFKTSEVTLATGSVEITVWYPTPKKRSDGDAYHAIQTRSLLGVIGPPTQLVLPARAKRDAPIKGGKHPLILNYTGGGQGNHLRLRDIRANELLAARGYVVVAPGRNTTMLASQGPLLSSLIDYMFGESAFWDSIDANRIGARGASFGGLGVLSLAGGDVLGNAPDDRVRAFVVDESVSACADGWIPDCTSITRPLMLRDGSVFSGSDMATLFSDLDHAFPRFLVTLDNPAHISFSTGQCALIEAQRQASLSYQMVEPEPRRIGYFPIGLGLGDTAGVDASLIWNLDLVAPTLGSAGDFCGPDFGGPVTPGLGSVLDNQAMIETLHALNLGFWQTAFRDDRSKRTKLEKAASRLDTVQSITKITD